MKGVPRESFRTAVFMTLVVILATVLVSVVDVQPAGVEGTNIGFASVNTGFFSRFGQNDTFYKISKYAGLLCFAAAGGFGCFFLLQLFRRKSLAKVDRNLTVLVMLYILTAALYLLFEKVLVINYRPILRDKGLESSYPSTHVLLAWVICVSAVDQWNVYIRNQKLLTAVVALTFLTLMAVLVCRTLSGVHWLTDIIGGVLLGDALIAWYRAVVTAQKN